MTVVTRAIAPGVVLMAMLAAGCSSASSASGAGSAATASPAAAAAASASATAPATAVPAAASVIPSDGTSARAIPSVTISAWASGSPEGSDVYLAESQDPRGTTVREPRCGAGCPLSGDGTTVLWNMTWARWSGAEAVGTGTERIESCNPDCASGGQYAVKVVVTLTQPVKDCGDGGIYFWTHASFDWPAGLPAALGNGSAPVNPWDFSQLRAQATASCTQP